MLRKLAAIFACVLFLSAYDFGQTRSNDIIARDIRKLNEDKHIFLSTNQGTSKIMAVAENFDDREVGHAGIRAMNFALGAFYPGSELAASPDPVMLSFWVKTKEPRFAAAHALKVVVDGQTLEIGDARYAAKPREDMEYLNFNLTRRQLAQIAAGGQIRAVIGAKEFTVTPAQLKLIRDFLAITDL